MAIIKKTEFIIHFIESLRKELERELPEEGFLFEMQDRVWGIIAEKCTHIRSRND